MEAFAQACGTQMPQALTLIVVLDDLTETRAIPHALDLAFADLEKAGRHALRTVAEVALGRLDGVCMQVEVLRGEGAVMVGQGLKQQTRSSLSPRFDPLRVAPIQ